jgi:hypothetical protein
MKKMLSLERKTVFVVLAGAMLLVVSASNMAQGQGMSAGLSLAQTLGKDQIEETVQISLGLAEQSTAEIRVDYLHPSAEITLPGVYKPQKYELRGQARMKPGKRVKVEGRGILLAQIYLAEAMSRPTAVGGFLTVWQSIMRDITHADPELFPAHRIRWQTPGLAGHEEIAAAEKRLGMPLPAIYQETMQRSGPWRVSLLNGFSFELLAPSQLLSASDWLQRYYGPVEWETPENQARRQQLRQDIVFAVVNNEPWVFRYSGTPCGDEPPAFALGQTASEGFYVSGINACGAEEQLEAIRQQMLEAFYRALLTPEFAVVNNDQRLHFERSRSPEKRVLQLHLKAGI